MTDHPKQNRREHYKYHLHIPTRWRDNDVYHHVNNAIYYEFFDTAINGYLIQHGGLDYTNGDIVGFAVETHCQFLKSIRFPEVIEAGLRVTQLGKSSVRYDVAIFKPNEDDPAAVGYFVHVFVNRQTNQSTRIEGILREAMEALMMDS